MIRPPSRLVRLLPLLLLAVVAAAGCGDDATGPSEDLRGQWETTALGGTLYMDITANTLTLYAPGGTGCHQVAEYDLEHLSGDRYRLSVDDFVVVELTLRVEDGELTVQDEDGSQLFVLQRSTFDLGTIEECSAGGGGDPSFVCSELPAVQPGESIEGGLSETDHDTGDHYFDLYGLTLTSSATVSISMESGELDPYLVLYSEGGELLIADDDGGTGANARIDAQLEPGCYRVEASSFDIHETGAYTLSVD